MKEVEILEKGGIILYPTDTIWGLGCEATQPLAIKRIIELKGRDETKNLLLLVKDIEMLSQYVEYIPDPALELIQTTENPLTIIYPKAKNLPIEFLSNNKSIGIRIANHPYCNELISKLNKPLVSTSANISGNPSPKNFESIDIRIKQGVDYIADRKYDTSNKNTSSRIVLIKEDGSIVNIR